MSLNQVVVHIVGTNTVFGLVDEKGSCYLKHEISTESYLSADSLIDRLFHSFKEKFDPVRNIFELIEIGLAVPSANYFKGTEENPGNLNWDYVNVAELVNKYYDLQVSVINDANAAIGEMK